VLYPPPPPPPIDVIVENVELVPFGVREPIT
jgi:hypothetical protein